MSEQKAQIQIRLLLKEHTLTGSTVFAMPSAYVVPTNTCTLLLQLLELTHCITPSGYFQIKVSHETRSVGCDA